ncbi:class I SAM-dependent methyltransferase [Dactylosporangium darangshiense]|uniref:Class I SAM-dependent methyltransferase n=1 Tax=Dactylosporangium darangshiense TaxID=579108 RepID=A0ABP8DVD6_9ACTN
MTSVTEAPPYAEPELLRLVTVLRSAGYRFTTVTPATHERVNRRPGNARGRSLTDVLGWSRPFEPRALPPDVFALLDGAGVLRRDGDLWRSLIRVSSYGGELFVHSTFPPTAPDAVFFGPDTHRTAEAALAHLVGRSAPPRRIVDVGCGSGAVAVTIAKKVPQAEVLAVDINPAALRLSRVNAAAAGVTNVQIRRSDLLSDVAGDFDLIVSNPPFMIDSERRFYRDGGGPHGHDLPMALVEAAVHRLSPGGALVLFSGTGIVEGRDPLLNAVTDRLAGTGLCWTYREIDPDAYGENLEGPAYAHADRIALVVLTATRPGEVR